MKIKRNRIIKMSYCQVTSLFFANIFKDCYPTINDNKLWRLFRQGQGRIDREFDIVKIIKNLRNIRIYMRQNHFDPKTKILIANQRKNLIDIDSPSSSDTSEKSNSDYSGEEDG